MKTISSAEFRKVYPRLTEDAIVTVNGHPIGRWEPVGQERGTLAPAIMSVDEHRELMATGRVNGFERIRAPEFRPAPKPSQRKR